MSKNMKREGPDSVEPIIIGNIRFEVVHWAKDIGCPQDGGYIIAVDRDSNQQLWVLRVYQTAYEDDREQDVQDVFITKLTAVNEDRKLAIENERGDRYTVDIETRTVTHGS